MKKALKAHYISNVFYKNNTFLNLLFNMLIFYILYHKENKRITALKIGKSMTSCITHCKDACRNDVMVCCD